MEEPETLSHHEEDNCGLMRTGPTGLLPECDTGFCSGCLGVSVPCVAPTQLSLQSFNSGVFFFPKARMLHALA